MATIQLVTLDPLEIDRFQDLNFKAKCPTYDKDSDKHILICTQIRRDVQVQEINYKKWLYETIYCLILDLYDFSSHHSFFFQKILHVVNHYMEIHLYDHSLYFYVYHSL